MVVARGLGEGRNKELLLIGRGFLKGDKNVLELVVIFFFLKKKLGK